MFTLSEYLINKDVFIIISITIITSICNKHYTDAFQTLVLAHRCIHVTVVTELDRQTDCCIRLQQAAALVETTRRC